jgi:hypothetical protein
VQAFRCKEAAPVGRNRNPVREAANSRGGARRKKVFRRPEHWPYDRFSVIQSTAWAGATVACIGGGPSLSTDQCAVVQQRQRSHGWKCIAVNDAYKAVPTADICYFADSQWWRWHKDREEFKAFAGIKASIEQTGAEIEDDDVHMVRNAAAVATALHAYGDGQTGGLSAFPNALRSGSNGGYQALGLAIAAGAARVLLLGYDMKFSGGKSHWHGGHAGARTTDDHPYRTTYTKAFEQLTLPPGVQVINCTPDSNVRCFPFQPVDGVF